MTAEAYDLVGQSSPAQGQPNLVEADFIPGGGHPYRMQVGRRVALEAKCNCIIIYQILQETALPQLYVALGAQHLVGVFYAIDLFCVLFHAARKVEIACCCTANGLNPNDSRHHGYQAKDENSREKPVGDMGPNPL